MQLVIDQAKVESFKNWFFGRTSVESYEDQDFSDVPVHLQTESDLPVEGNPDLKYYVVETGDTYRFVDGGYQVVDVYSFGITQQYRDAPRRVVHRNEITDPSFNIPHISAEQIKAGASATLATLYNIQALLTDLEQIRRSEVYGYKTSLMDVLGKGQYLDKQENVTQWFAREHKLLHRLLASAMRSKDIFSKPIIDALFVHKYVLTWDDTKNRAVFKVEDFVVHL